MVICAGLMGCNDGGGSSAPAAPVYPDRIVALGDSITGDYNGDEAGAPYPPRLSQLLGKNVINEGEGGERSGAGEERCGSVIETHAAQCLLVLYGANDVLDGRSTESLQANLRAIIGAAKGRACDVFIATLTPMVGRRIGWNGAVTRASEAIRALAVEQNVPIVDLNAAFSADPEGLMTSDGLHPNDAGNQLIAFEFEEQMAAFYRNRGGGDAGATGDSLTGVAADADTVTEALK